jgi:DNA-binding MarR family transcriptional regulator
VPRPRKPTPPVDELVGAAALAARWSDRVLAGHDPPLTVSQYLALRSIRREQVTATEMARRAGVSGPAVSQLIAGLERAGWIARSALADDRRRQKLELTSTGAAVLDSAALALRGGIGPLLELMPGPELHALERLLSLLESVLGGTPPPRRPGPPRPPEGHPRRRR